MKARHLLAGVLLVTASAAAADILVVRSIGPSAKSFPPGKRLAETARISLKNGDQLIVLDGRGTRTVRGPGTFTAGIPVGNLQTASVAQPRRAAASRARIGAVRGPGDTELRPPSIWHVDVAKSATICVAEPKVTLWRANPAKPVMLSITRMSDGAVRQINWQAGESTAAWPADLAVADGAQYRLSSGGGAAPTTIGFRTMPQKPAGLEDMASSLIRGNCTAQLDHLIETVRLPDEKKPAG